MKNVKRAKAAAAKAATKPTARKSVARTVFAHWPEGSSAYINVRGAARGALILAALIVAGYAKPTKAGLTTTKKEGNRALFTGLVGNTPLAHHTREKRIVKNVLSAEGAKWFTARGVDPDLVKSLTTAMQKGGEVEGLKFSHKRTG